MVAEIGVGAIILTEELPARYRGAGVTLMFTLSLLGGVAGSVIFPWVIDTSLGWRTLYLGGGLLLPVLAFYWRRLRETERWQRTVRNRTPGRTGFGMGFRELAILWEHRYRRRVVAGAVIWFTVNAWSSSCLFFFTYYVTRERGWASSEVSRTLTVGYLLAVVGYATAGPMLDFAGRRLTAFLYFTLGGIAAVVCFLAQSARVITLAYILVLSMHALWPIAATITSEIFPTQMRGLANGVVNNLLGRTGIVLAPGIVGALSAWFGSVGEAVALVSGTTFLCLPAVLFLISETRGQTLEEIG
jgi:putative MFS transporter